MSVMRLMKFLFILSKGDRGDRGRPLNYNFLG